MARTKKGSYSKFIIFLIVLLNTIFAFTVLFIFMSVGSEPVALIAAWFGFTTGELWLLTGIKKEKIKEVIKNENRLESEADI